MVCLYTFSNLFSFLLKITSHPPLPTFREKKRETECPFKDSFETSEGQRLTSDVQDSG